MSKLKGFITYSIDPKGEHFLSDAKPSLAAVKRQYASSVTTGYVDLSKIPNDAFIGKDGRAPAVDCGVCEPDDTNGF